MNKSTTQSLSLQWPLLRILLLTILSCNTIQPVASKDLMIEMWSPNVLDQEPLAEQFVNAGDTVTFKVYGPHTVFIHPSLSCDPTNRNELVPKDHEVTYTFQENDSDFFGNEMLFVCDAGTHCEQGQQVKFRVFPTPQPPSPAPSLRPSVNTTTDLLMIGGGGDAAAAVPNEANTGGGAALNANNERNELPDLAAEQSSSAFSSSKSLLLLLLVATVIGTSSIRVL